MTAPPGHAPCGATVEHSHPGIARACTGEHDLRLEQVKETRMRDTGIVSLSGRTYRGTVRVGLTARAYSPLPDDEAPSQEPAATEAPDAAATAGRPTHPARVARDPAGGKR